MFNPGVEKIARTSNSFFKFLFPLTTDHGIRIFAGWHFGDTNDTVILQKSIERALGRLLASGIGVKTENNFVYESFQNPSLILGKSRSLRRNNVCNPCFEDGNQIELPFTNNCAIGFNQPALGFVKAKEDAS